jgi:hypothetical protein
LIPEPTIDCIDCGETAHLLTYPPEDGRWHPGDLVTYRCSGCGDRWDLLVPDDPDDADELDQPLNPHPPVEG